MSRKICSGLQLGNDGQYPINHRSERSLDHIFRFPLHRVFDLTADLRARKKIIESMHEWWYWSLEGKRAVARIRLDGYGRFLCSEALLASTCSTYLPSPLPWLYNSISWRFNSETELREADISLCAQVPTFISTSRVHFNTFCTKHPASQHPHNSSCCKSVLVV